jgi:segregation and condensation protein B
MSEANIKHIVEAVLLAAGNPLTLDNLLAVFTEEDLKPGRDELRATIEALQADYEGRGIELVRVASGYRIQVSQRMEPWVSRLTDEKPARYSRALLETLALVAYRQPITRGEIEDIRGVGISSSIMKTLQEREWIRIVGHRDVPGRPAMYGTTRQFLDYFNLKSLDELPSLVELRDIDSFTKELELLMPGETQAPAESETQASGTGEADAVEEDHAPKIGLEGQDTTETLH